MEQTGGRAPDFGRERRAFHRSAGRRVQPSEREGSLRYQETPERQCSWSGSRIL